MRRSQKFAVGGTIAILGSVFSFYLTTLENRPQIGVVAFAVTAVTLYWGLTLIGKAIWPTDYPGGPG